MVLFGVASRSGKGRFFGNDLKLVFGFGFFATVELLLKSQGVTGVNMLHIADHRPEALKVCMQEVSRQIIAGELQPKIGGKFSVSQLHEAHNLLGNRKSMGKIVVHW